MLTSRVALSVETFVDRRAGQMPKFSHNIPLLRPCLAIRFFVMTSTAVGLVYSHFRILETSLKTFLEFFYGGSLYSLSTLTGKTTQRLVLLC